MLPPLLFVIFVTAVKDFYEDYKRRKSDRDENEKSVSVYSYKNQQWGLIQWQDLQVGQLIQIREDEFLPADCVLLASSGLKGMSFVETKNLDGETNLKHKLALKATNTQFTSHEVTGPQINKSSVSAVEENSNMHIF